MIDLPDASDRTVIRWWCEFNCWRWPEDFPLPKPENWEGLYDRERHKSDRGQEAWKLIYDELGRRRISMNSVLEYWNGPFDRGHGRLEAT